MSTDIRKKMWEALASKPNVMLSLQGSNDHSEPMHVQLDKNADSEFWFFTTKTNRVAKGGPAMVHFSSKGHDIFACIRGTLVVENRAEVIDKYWSNPVSAWYDEGRDDPQLLVMRMELQDAEIWSADPSVKGMFKLLTGQKVDPDQMGDHAKVDV